MALDYQTFINKFPEFTKAPAPSVVEEAIATEDRFVADSWASDVRDDYVAYRVADHLAHSPTGRNARLVDAKTGVSVYSMKLRRYEKAHACARSRTGSTRG